MSAQITVEQFLQVREHVAEALKEGSQTQKPTRVRQAEHLMQLGIIDIPAVLEILTPEPPLSPLAQAMLNDLASLPMPVVTETKSLAEALGVEEPAPEPESRIRCRRKGCLLNFHSAAENHIFAESEGY